jgi:hypothetical protein
MHTIYFDSRMSDDARRAQLYGGSDVAHIPPELVAMYEPGVGAGRG